MHVYNLSDLLPISPSFIRFSGATEAELGERGSGFKGSRVRELLSSDFINALSILSTS